MPYDRVTVNMEREEVCLERTMSHRDPRLISTTTGGVEASWRDCLLPFGLVVSIVGLAATSVGCANDSPGSVLSILGWTVLGVGVLGVAVSCLCQKYYKRREKKRRGSWSMLMGDSEAKKKVVV